MTIQAAPFLRVQRNFPNNDVKTLSVENDRAYIDIASKVNDRTIGLFAAGVAAITGEQWFLSGSAQQQQTFRQAYPFTSTAAINHGIDTSNITYITRMYGQYLDAGGNWDGLIAATPTAIVGQISFYLTPTQIIFVSGAGAPTVSRGIIVLEWLAVF